MDIASSASWPRIFIYFAFRHVECCFRNYSLTAGDGLDARRTCNVNTAPCKGAQETLLKLYRLTSDVWRRYCRYFRLNLTALRAHAPAADAPENFQAKKKPPENFPTETKIRTQTIFQRFFDNNFPENFPITIFRTEIFSWKYFCGNIFRTFPGKFPGAPAADSSTPYVRHMKSTGRHAVKFCLSSYAQSIGG